MGGGAILGCKSTTRYLFHGVRDVVPIEALVTISPELGLKHDVADYDDLGDLGTSVQVHRAASYSLGSSEDLEFFGSARFDFLLVAGWQRLIPDSVLGTLRTGAFGMHGSSQDLPSGRGRSPLNWSIVEDRRWFFTNLFRYLPGIDDGPIVDSACFSINASDTAESLHIKNLLSMVALVRRHAVGLETGELPLREQGEGEPTYYPKRTPGDSLIDWRKDVFALDRHIRAVAPPFNGAFSFAASGRVMIDRATILFTDIEAHPFLGQQPGKICAILPTGKFCVRTVGGVLLVHEYRLGSDFSLQEGDMLRSPPEEIREFPRNPQGFFDLPKSH
jgi:methionyl-tRNA formyltransferase